MEHFTSAIMWGIFITTTCKLSLMAINFKKIKENHDESEAIAIAKGEYKITLPIGTGLYLASIIYLFF